jgi:hypothetical protein
LAEVLRTRDVVVPPNPIGISGVPLSFWRRFGALLPTSNKSAYVLGLIIGASEED